MPLLLPSQSATDGQPEQFNLRPPSQVRPHRDGSRTTPPVQHSIPFFTSLPSTLDKGYLELAGASHFAPNIPNSTIAEFSIAWLKRFVDNDTRFEQFRCPGPAVTSAVSQYRADCPHRG
jgi:hypothetical protein